MAEKHLNWSQLRALHELYETGRTKARILNNDYINTLKVEKRLIRTRPGFSNILEVAPGYFKFYEENFKENYQQYSAFLTTANLFQDGKRKYDEYDLKTLMFIYENKDELKSKLTTVRQFSAKVFRGSKYLENHQGLKKAVCQILEIEDFPDKDEQVQQWRLTIDCPSPQIVILCENIAFLKEPWKARNNNIELWYVGGNNVSIIDYIPVNKLHLPLFYCCDWDLAGLQIYSRVKRIMERKNYQITLLKPNDVSAALPTNSPYHSSEWNNAKPFSGLEENDFDEEAKHLIKHLIEKKLWIEEESQDLIEILQKNDIKVQVNGYSN